MSDETECKCPGFWESDLCITVRDVPTIFTFCGDENCGGACEAAGPCSCPLHATIGDHDVPEEQRPALGAPGNLEEAP
jgi:hypothetical protein